MWYNVRMRRKVLIALRMAGVAGQDKFCGIFRYLGKNHDWDITLIRTAAEFTPERMRTALKEGYDGYIVSIPDTEKTAALLAKSSVPTIVMDIHDPELSARKKNIVFIRNSAKEIGVTAANHLLGIGRCRSYAFIQNESIKEWGVDRCRYFREALRDRGLWCEDLPGPEEIRLLERPVGIFASNDDTGYDVLEYCRAHKLRVPEDVIVLGNNNDTLVCENCRPRLSSIQPDFEQEGFLAAKTLDSMMRGDSAAERTIYVGVKAVVRRESTAAISQAGQLVQRAVAYIRKHATEGIGVEDVVRHLGCSRRLADLRFRELQNTSIGESIISEKLHLVKRLLTETDERIDAIAAQCGFENPNYLKNLFKKRFGMTMREWRNR